MRSATETLEKRRKSTRKSTQNRGEFDAKSIEVGSSGYVEVPKSIEDGRSGPVEAPKSIEVGRSRVSRSMLARSSFATQRRQPDSLGKIVIDNNNNNQNDNCPTMLTDLARFGMLDRPRSTRFARPGRFVRPTSIDFGASTGPERPTSIDLGASTYLKRPTSIDFASSLT